MFRQRLIAFLLLAFNVLAIGFLSDPYFGISRISISDLENVVTVKSEILSKVEYIAQRDFFNRDVAVVRFASGRTRLIVRDDGDSEVRLDALLRKQHFAATAICLFSIETPLLAFVALLWLPFLLMAVKRGVQNLAVGV